MSGRRQLTKVQAYGTSRVCANPDCDTVLSRYNPSEVCSNCDDGGQVTATGRLRKRSGNPHGQPRKPGAWSRRARVGPAEQAVFEALGEDHEWCPAIELLRRSELRADRFYDTVERLLLHETIEQKLDWRTNQTLYRRRP